MTLMGCLEACSFHSLFRISFSAAKNNKKIILLVHDMCIDVAGSCILLAFATRSLNALLGSAYTVDLYLSKKMVLQQRMTFGLTPTMTSCFQEPETKAIKKLNFQKHLRKTEAFSARKFQAQISVFEILKFLCT